MPKLPSSTPLFLLFTLSSFLPSSHPTTFSGDVSALRAFKSAVSPATIPPNSCLATWNFSTADPCSLPRTTHFTCGLTCSGNRVIQLTLDSQGYAGTITPIISNLTQLTTIDMADNNFYGTIPSSISTLPNLKNLILRVNSLSGPIPDSITNLKSLETLDLSRNGLSGSLPHMDSLSGLIRLDLSYNNLTGSLPKLPINLNELALKANSLSGSLSNSSFHGLTRLMVVELSENLFSGTIEPWFFMLPSLQQVDLSNNSFTRVVITSPPASFGSELVAVDLSFNGIQGLLPANFIDYPMLRSLALSYNQLRGPIPWQYSDKRALRRLFLDGNYLNGSPPARFFTGTVTVSGSLGDNCLRSCPVSSELCLKAQKPASICQQAYGGKTN